MLIMLLLNTIRLQIIQRHSNTRVTKIWLRNTITDHRADLGKRKENLSKEGNKESQVFREPLIRLKGRTGPKNNTRGTQTMM